MSYRNAAIALGSLLALSLLIPKRAEAQVEVEADPIAYALNGFSLHVAKIVGSYRFNLGTFGIDVPRAFHGNDDWDATMRGAGIKVDHLGSGVNGFFVGADAGYMRMTYALDGDPRDVRRGEINAGVRTGYRLPIGRSGLYIAPWVGVSYNLKGGDVVLGDSRFEHGAVTVFPTVHVGWRF